MTGPSDSRVRAGLRRAGRAALRVLRFSLDIVLALILLFEEWGWRPLGRLIAQLARFRLWRRLEAGIAALPPYPALVVFALPTTLLFPVKIAALYLLAQGHVIFAGLTLFAAKVVSTALIARIFALTQPQLMRLAWFARLYTWFIPWKEHVFAYIRSSWAWRYGRIVKARLAARVRRMWLRLEPRLEGLKRQARSAWYRLRLLLRKIGSR